MYTVDYLYYLEGSVLVSLSKLVLRLSNISNSTNSSID